MRSALYRAVMIYVALSLVLPAQVAAQPEGQAPPPDAVPVDAEARAVETTAPEPAWTPISGTTTVLMTPVFPGWGQLYAENSWRAATTFGFLTWFWTGVLRNDRQAERHKEFSLTLDADGYGRADYDDLSVENREMARDFGWWAAGALFISCLDAYVGALLYNFDEDPVAVPNDWQILEPAPLLDTATGDLDIGVVLLGWRSSF